tara:strand:+ start:71 stop:244 length:174 start_codon:yes stop_codon:yes gene_type:complete
MRGRPPTKGVFSNNALFLRRRYPLARQDYVAQKKAAPSYEGGFMDLRDPEQLEIIAY